MNISNKHLVINAVSIFLALALGLLIGLSMGSGTLIEDRTGDVISQIEEQFKYLKEENEKNLDEIKKVNDTNIQLDYSFGILSNKLIENQLVEKNIAIVNLNEDYDYSDVRMALEKAGASITSVTTIDSAMLKESNELKALAEETSGQKLEGNDLFAYLGTEYGKVIANGESSDAVVKTMENNMARFEGDYSVTPELIVVCGGNKEEVKNLNPYTDKLFEIFRDSEKSTIGVQSSEAKVSLLQKYKDYGFSTVSNIDANIGKLSLILALKGHPGNYGAANEDDTVVPDLTLLD